MESQSRVTAPMPATACPAIPKAIPKACMKRHQHRHFRLQPPLGYQIRFCFPEEDFHKPPPSTVPIEIAVNLLAFGSPDSVCSH